MKILSITLMVIGLFLLIGCTASGTPLEPGPVTNAKAIVGTWEHFGEYTQFNEDGTCRTAPSLERLAERPWIISEFWFEGGQYFEKEIEARNVPSCGSIGIYEVQMLENGNLVFTSVKDECDGRASHTVGEYKRVD